MELYECNSINALPQVEMASTGDGMPTTPDWCTAATRKSYCLPAPRPVTAAVMPLVCCTASQFAAAPAQVTVMQMRQDKTIQSITIVQWHSNYKTTTTQWSIKNRNIIGNNFIKSSNFHGFCTIGKRIEYSTKPLYYFPPHLDTDPPLPWEN